jgi:hypothetical protein
MPLSASCRPSADFCHSFHNIWKRCWATPAQSLPSGASVAVSDRNSPSMDADPPLTRDDNPANCSGVTLIPLMAQPPPLEPRLLRPLPASDGRRPRDYATETVHRGDDLHADELFTDEGLDLLTGEHVVGVDDPVRIALLGEKPLPVRCVVLVESVAGDDGVEAGGAAVVLGPQDPP